MADDGADQGRNPEGQPGGQGGTRQRAPAPLEVVQLFVNTIDIETGEEQLTDPRALGRWLRAHGLLEGGAEPTRADLRRAMEIREALRALLLANNGERLDPTAVARLNRAAERARLTVSFDDRGASRLRPLSGGVDGALGRLLAVVSTSMADGTWSRLKACRAHSCAWAFYDRSKNRSSTWCAMAVCGNRAKARAYRERSRRT